MDIATRLILPSEVRLTPVAQLSGALRDRIDCEESDFAVSSPNARISSTVVDTDTAGLLDRFRRPCTLTEAVILYSLPRKLDPQQVLTGVWPVVTKFYQIGLLRDQDAEAPRELGLHPGDDVDGCTVLAPLRVMEDSELHQVRRPDGHISVLKFLRQQAQTVVGSTEREAEVLERLAGRFVPAVLGRGEVEGTPYLELEWCPGIDPVSAGSEWRARWDGASKLELLALCLAVAEAYAQLHAQGVLHRDVHPGNVLVAADGSVRLVDFGLAVQLDRGEPETGNAGVPFYFEPERAQGLLAGISSPGSTAGEQFSVAAMLYRIVTECYYLDFEIEWERLLHQILKEQPLPFAARGLPPWPELEAVLHRALAKDPEDRFASMGELVAALREITVPQVSDASAPSGAVSSGGGISSRLTADLLAQAAGDGAWLREGLPSPRASVCYGAAGVAYALYRIACQRDDPELLELADIWGCRARSELRTGDTALYEEKMELTRELVGEVSPYHCASGVFMVQAQIAHARSDELSRDEAIQAFVLATSASCEALDLTLGAAGPLLGCARLLDLVPAGSDPHQQLSRHGEGLLTALWKRLEAQPPTVLTSPDSPGIAHGWAGQLYAVLQWCRASDTAPPQGLRARLEQLRTLARPWGQGLRWPCRMPGRSLGSAATEEPSMAGWCHGSGGFVFLWSLAARVLGEPRYDDFVEGAALDTWHHPETVANLCCGLAGRAYALIHLYRRSGTTLWLRRAEDLACRSATAVFDPERPYSLFKGALILPVLAADLEHPAGSVFPCFEEEDWS